MISYYLPTLRLRSNLDFPPTCVDSINACVRQTHAPIVPLFYGHWGPGGGGLPYEKVVVSLGSRNEGFWSRKIPLSHPENSMPKGASPT